MNVGSTSVILPTCLAGRFLGWMLPARTLQCKRRSKRCAPARRRAHLCPAAQVQLPCGRTRRDAVDLPSKRGGTAFSPRETQWQTKRAAGMANPTRLKPFNKDDGVDFKSSLETPKDSPKKFAFDPKQAHLRRSEGAAGGDGVSVRFWVSATETLAPDGDPIDVLLLMDEPAYPGCMVAARLIGVIEGEQP